MWSPCKCRWVVSRLWVWPKNPGGVADFATFKRSAQVEPRWNWARSSVLWRSPVQPKEFRWLSGWWRNVLGRWRNFLLLCGMSYTEPGRVWGAWTWSINWQDVVSTCNAIPARWDCSGQLSVLQGPVLCWTILRRCVLKSEWKDLQNTWTRTLAVQNMVNFEFSHGLIHHLGNLAIQAPSGSRLPAWAGCVPVSQWCLGGVSWCLGSLLEVSGRCLHGVVLFWWFLASAFMVSRWPQWCLGGGLVVSQRFPCWYKLQGVCGVLVVSWWRRVGVEAVVLVVGWLCLSAASLRVIQIFI